ncbi:hypothetical protein [Vibrio nigripulchritudo]|nr:hypothetical protein [Vibrio nigripulchritudo]
MIKKHFQTITVAILVAVSLVLLIVIADSVNRSPVREAYIRQGESIQKMKVRSVGSLSDAKLINFVERVIVTCFSLTPINYQTKSEYCAEQYFAYNAGRVYQRLYAQRVGRQIEEDEGTNYAAASWKPVIAVPWERTNYKYYVVVFPTVVTKVLRTSRHPQTRIARLFVRPSIKSTNPYQFEIIGFRI